MAASLAACVPTPGDVNDIVNNALDNLQSDSDNDSDIDLDFNIDTDDDNDDDNDDNTNETVSVNFDANMAEQVVYNNKGIKVTAAEITYEEYYGPTIAFLVENESDKDISISTDYITVNNFNLVSNCIKMENRSTKNYILQRLFLSYKSIYNTKIS